MSAKLPFPVDLYFHREHTWILREKRDIGDLFRIGLDELFLKDVGKIDRLDLPTEGDELTQDEVCGIVRGEIGKKLLFAPLSGEIVDVNFELHEDPDVIREDPYGIGWIFLVDPNDPAEELESLLKGDEALQWWETEVALRKPQPR
ncbi:MAG: glycine cleavage system protein H [bacterium]|nr:glycine cleavage system protein H [bacterium]